MAEEYINLKKTVLTLIEEKSFQRLRDILITMQPADIAALFSELSEKTLPLVFRLLPKDLAAETFVEMDSDLQHHLIQGFSDAELQEVVNELYVDDAAALIEEMPANVVKRILRQADPETRWQINEILKYPEDSAGSIMTTEFVSLRA
ncbi:MAG: magnesium transporter, partial [Firmicutes bacterium]|nr:magnesium transporter [Bacillota bacterium]